MPNKPVYSKSLAKGIVVFTCLLCGTEWTARTSPTGGTGWTGFLEVNVRFHGYGCERMSPTERLAQIERTRKRIERRPNKHTSIYFNMKHPGLKVQDPRGK